LTKKTKMNMHVSKANYKGKWELTIWTFVLFLYLCFFQLVKGALTNGFFFPKRSHLIGPSQIFWEHGALPKYKSLNVFPSPNKSMFCHASLWSPLPLPLPYNLYTWKLNHDPTIHNKKLSIIGNVLVNTLRTFWELDGT